ncbi:MAG: hypothetical protein VR72_08110 [Clostridiaceae bacterium BRH_c20a]|nr:MAG: hypothetical protein VR72_08110 [Clostridiaceae bacterium BRH_c20a]
MYAGTLGPYNHMGLTGKDYDAESGFIDFGFRWYDPQAGRFTQPDTYKGNIFNPLTQHPYAYVGNNPVLCFLGGKNKNMVNSNKSV